MADLKINLIEVEVNDGVASYNGNPMTQWKFVPILNGGAMQLRDTKKGLHMAVFSKSGKFQYSTSMRRDGKYQFGLRFGHRIIETSEEKHPIKKVMRALQIPVGKLKLMKSDEPLTISPDDDNDGVWYPIEAMIYENHELRGVKYYAQLQLIENKFGIDGVWVWPDCTPSELLDFLSPYSQHFRDNLEEVMESLRNVF